MKWVTSDLLGFWRRLRREPTVANFAWLTYERLFRLGLGLLVGTWVARYLGPSDYGTLSYGISITGILSVIPMLGLDAIVRRELRDRPQAGDAILGTAFLLKLAAGLLTYVATLVGVYFLESNATARFVIVVTSLLQVQQAMMIFDVFFQAQVTAKYSVWAQNIAFAVSAAGRVGLILAGAHIEAFALMLVIEMPVMSALFVWFYRRGGGRISGWRWDGSVARALLTQSWPIAFGAIANIVYLRVDQVLVIHLAGSGEAGRYAAAARLYELCGFLPVVLANSLSPALFAAYRGDTAEYTERARRLFLRLAQIAWLVAVPGILLSPVLVRVLYGSAYAPSSAMFALLLLGYPFLAMAIAREQLLVAEQKTRFQLVAMLIGVVSSITLNVALIPRFGGLGAAIAITLSQIIAGVASSFLRSDLRPIGQRQLLALVGRAR